MRALITVGISLFVGTFVQADSCSALIQSLKLPQKIKTGGKPRVMKWDKIEKTLTLVREKFEGTDCRLTFEQVFAADREEVFFPILTNLLRTAPEDSMAGVSVYNQQGEKVGQFENRVVFEKQGEYSYRHYYFQFRDAQGELQSSGNRLLIDVETGSPFFVTNWSEVKSRTLWAPPE